MSEEWTSALKRDVEPLLDKMDVGVDVVVECTQQGDLSGAWEAMQELGQTGRRMHEAMQPYVTGEIPAAMPAATYEALSDVCWASHSWFTAVQEVEAVVSDAEMSGQGFETPELAEQIDTCVATWKGSRAKLDEAGGLG
jgi:hypothetical protein